MSRIYKPILCYISEGASATIILWLARWIVGDWVNITSLPLSLYAWITSLDFSYSDSVALPLTSLTNLELNILPLCLWGSYDTKSNISFAIRASISCFWDAWNGCPRVVITPFCLNSSISLRSASSFRVIKTSLRLIPCYMAVVNWLSISSMSFK